MTRLLAGMGVVVSRRAEMPSAGTVVMVPTGPYHSTLALRQPGERAEPCHTALEIPTVRLTMDGETYACLAFGRWASAKVLQAGRVLLAGDRQLGRSIVRHMAVAPKRGGPDTGYALICGARRRTLRDRSKAMTRA
jgi:hypothetical protein